MTGRTNALAAAGASYVPGADVIVSHSAGTDGMTDHGIVTMTDGDYRLLEIKQSGTLTFDSDQVAQGIFAGICIVGGGQGGGYGAGRGGDGGFLRNIATFLKNAVVVIGAGGAGSSTSISGDAGGSSSMALQGSPDLITAATSSAGSGSGGGQGGSSPTAGFGDGINKYPFGDSAYFNIHSGGGGGGPYYHWYYESSSYYSGGNGGTDGDNGSGRISGIYTPGTADSSAGAGGNYNQVGYSAAYYGGGGGGGGSNYAYVSGSYQTVRYAGGAGYQGVIWMRVPA